MELQGVGMKQIDTLTQIQKTIKESEAVLLYVSAPNCNVCDALKPKVTELFDKKFPKIVQISANIADIPELGAQFQIFSAPAILIFFDRKEFAREGRNVSLELLQSRVEKIYNLYFS